MKAGSRLIRRLLIIACVLLVQVGCLGITQNPVKFPYFLPTGNIEFTHAKPPGLGYFTNFDPFACRLEVRPKEISQAVGGSQVLIATIYDNSGQPRRARRVEWMLEGKGHIIEVDESGYYAGRGYKVDNRYAVSYTSYKEHTFTRGNGNPTDDFIIRPGQTWCVITSPVEGDTQVTVFAPEIHNWDKHKVVVTTHWVNAGWVFPTPQQCRGGSPCLLTTNVYRMTDQMPLANYRIRYTILDGPPAVFTNSQQRIGEVITDLLGNGTISLQQTVPQEGVSRIGIEVIRPPDPCCPTGPGIIIGRGETTVEWTAPSLTITKSGPAAVAVGQSFHYTITLHNNGRSDSEPLTVRDVIPDGLTFLSASQRENREGNQLIFTVPPVRPGMPYTIELTFRADRLGTINNIASVQSADGMRAEASATTVVAPPGRLTVQVAGPATALVGEPIPYKITVTNVSTSPVSNISLLAAFDQGLIHATGDKPLEVPRFHLDGSQSQTFDLTLTARKEGLLNNRVTVTADGGISAEAEHAVQVSQPRLRLSVRGPKARYLRSRVEWIIQVKNDNPTALQNVQVRSQLPGEVSFLDASDGGQFQAGQVVWDLGTLESGQERQLRLFARAEQLAAQAVYRVHVSATPMIEEKTETAIELRGIPALSVELADNRDPVSVGDEVIYEVRLSNTGTLVTNNIELACVLSPELQFVKAIGSDGSVAEVRDGGQRLVFPQHNGLVPGTMLTYTITVRAEKAGDARFRTEIKSSLNSDPLIEEEPTNILPR